MKSLEKLPDLFGYSEFDPELRSLFPELAIPEERPEISVVWRTYRSSQWKIYLVFYNKHNFLHEYGPHGKEFFQGEFESFLEALEFGNQKEGGNYPGPLPFHVRMGDAPQVVCQKLGVRPAAPKESSYGTYQQYNLEKYSIVAGYDRQDKLVWFRIKPHEISYLKKKQLEKSFRSIDRILDASAGIKLEQLTLPTMEWRKRMKEGDELLTEKNIDETELQLKKFIADLSAAARAGKASKVYAAVRSLVKALNKLNEKYHSYMETLEAEEMAGYIHKAVSVTGFPVTEEVDLTEEWREW